MQRQKCSAGFGKLLAQHIWSKFCNGRPATLIHQNQLA